MNEIKIFNSPDFGSIRVLDINNEPWLVLKDVCDVLEIRNNRDVVARLDADEKDVGSIDTLGGTQNMTIINESGFYSVILRSDKPKAKPFRKWVTSEVLPSIRKHGAYMTPDVLEQTIQNPDYMIGLLNALKDEQERRKALETTVAVQTQQIQELTPKASYYDLILNCTDALTITTIAKDYGKSAKWLNELLHEKGVQFKQGDIWLLYQGYAEKGYTCTKTHNYNGNDGRQHSKVHTYWTQKGRIFIYELLKKDGILPLIEREKAA